MFVGYENFSTYFVDNGDQGQADFTETDDDVNLPAEYRLKFPSIDPWFRSGVVRDFIILAEFNELEGPIPRVVIPSDIYCNNFCIDTFVVRLMSVDHQRTTGTSFTVCDDAQVILSQSEHGLYTYVHHFTLYDLAGRGYVRPFCLAYVTPDYDKLMNFYVELSEEFSRVTRLFKSGNHLVFLHNMTHRLSDLQYTKERYTEQQSNSEQSNSSVNDVTLESLNKSIDEVKHILQIVVDLVEKEMSTSVESLCDHSSSSHDGIDLSLSLSNDAVDEVNRQPPSSKNSGTDLCQSYKPQLLNAVGRKMPKTLSTLAELCQQNAKLGLKAINEIYSYFGRDLSCLLMEKDDLSRAEPAVGLFAIGRCIAINFFNCIQNSLEDSEDSLSSPLSASTLPSSNSTSEGFVTCTSVESFSSCLGDAKSDAEPDSSCHQPQVNGVNSGDKVDGERVDQGALKRSQGKPTQQTVDEGLVGRRKSHCSSAATSRDVTNIADHIEQLNDRSTGFGLLHFVYQFSTSPHILFSILIGRPVVVIGSSYNEREIRAIVTALCMFVPGHFSAIIPWSENPLSFESLANVKLIGIGRADKKSFDSMLPRNVQTLVTVLNLDKKTLWCPKYQGNLLNEILAAKDNFKSDCSFIAFIHSKLYELAQQSFIYFHSFTIRKSASYSDSINSLSGQLTWRRSLSYLTSQFKLSADDLLIVQYFVSVIRRQQVLKFDCEASQHSIYINHEKCHLFTL